MPTLRQRFGKLVAAHRRDKNLTQAELAELTDQSKDMIAKIEGGKTGVSFENIEQLARSLDIDPAAFFSAELSASTFKGSAKRRILEKITLLAESDLLWVEALLSAALKPRHREAPLDKRRIKTRIAKQPQRRGK